MSVLGAFLRFEVLRLLRSWKFLAITVGFPVIFYLLFLHNHTPSAAIDGGVAWNEYLMVSMGSFGALVAALNAGGTRLSMERSTGWARQLRVTPLPEWSYVATKVTASMLVVLPVLVLVDVVGTAFGGVHLDPSLYVALGALQWISALPFALLGVLVGFVVNAEAAYPVVTALMFILGYFGGLFTPVSHMPDVLQSLARAMPSFHHDALGLALLDGRGFGFEHALVLAGYTAVLGAVIVWKHRVEEARGLA